MNEQFAQVIRAENYGTRRRVACLASPMPLVRELGKVCRELREQAGARHDDISYHLPVQRGRDPRTVREFEAGKSQPKNLDAVLSAYEAELEIPALAIVRLALERLEKKAADQTAETIRQARAANSQARKAAPSRRTLAATPKPPSKPPRRQRQ